MIVWRKGGKGERTLKRNKQKSKRSEERVQSYAPKWMAHSLLSAWILFACAVATILLWQLLPAHGPEKSDRSRLFLEGETVDLSDEMYTYGDMMRDLYELSLLYPDRIRVSSAGVSADGREILYADVGPADAERQIFVSAGIHGRETIPPLIAMKLTEYYLVNYDAEDENGRAFSDVAGDCLFRVVPMVNPDGIALATEGPESIRREELKETVLAVFESDRREYASYGQYGTLEEYLKYWKANLRGVDLNRNFPIEQWETVSTGIPQPSSQKYKGGRAASEPETQAIVALLTGMDRLCAVVSLHSQGEILYWDCGQEGELRSRNQDLVKAIAEMTGYRSVDTFTAPDASLDDWAALNLGVPSVNIELGRGNILLPATQVQPIWNQIKGLWRLLAEW